VKTKQNESRNKTKTKTEQKEKRAKKKPGPAMIEHPTSSIPDNIWPQFNMMTVARRL
jgi:hypothetical protein